MSNFFPTKPSRNATDLDLDLIELKLHEYGNHYCESAMRDRQALESVGRAVDTRTSA